MNRKTRWIVGVDEAGRGPLAGPVYVGAYAIPRSFDMKNLAKVRDSKKLTEKAREDVFKDITALTEVRFSTGHSSASVIDNKGITIAIQRALAQALEGLTLAPEDCMVLLDGGLKAPESYTQQKTIVRGDATEKVIGAASIVAKVTRDKKMRTFARRYPQYGFEVHKGYGTEAHRSHIKKCGLSKIHRLSFCKNCLVKSVPKKK